MMHSQVELSAVASMSTAEYSWIQRFGFCILITSVLPSPIAAQGNTRERGPIIDMHLHAVPVASYPAQNRAKGYVTPKSDSEGLAATLRTLARYRVVRAVVSGPVELVRAWRRADSLRFVPGVLTDWVGDSHLEAITALARKHEIAVLGEITAQVAGVSPDDDRLESLWALAEELDLPIGIHVGPMMPAAAYRGFPRFRMDLSDALLLDRVLLRHPQLRLYVMHAGWPLADAMIGLLYAHPQVYVDIGVIAWILPRAEFHRYLERLVQAGFADRIMFGSDQMVWADLIGDTVEAVESAPFLSAQQKRDIFYNNAARFLRLSPEQIQRDHQR
jgi:predicted TIM-barrel fold metal-dependent hydrolase